MSDPLSIAAIILAAVDATKRISVYASDFKDAIEEKAHLKGNLDYLRSLLKTLHKQCENAPSDASWLPLLLNEYEEKDKYGVVRTKQKGILIQLKSIVNEMGDTVEPTKSWKQSDLYQRAVWHFKKDKIKEIDAQVSTLCGSINLIFTLKNDDTATTILKATRKFEEETGTSLQGVGIQLKNVDNHLENVDTRLSLMEISQRAEYAERQRRDQEHDLEKAQTEKRDIISWLSPLSFVAKQEELYAECFTKAGTWLWKDERFKQWAEGRSWFLQCKGDMGVGKTVLSSILSHRLPAAEAHTRLILSIYLDHKASRAQTLANLLGSLLKQLIQLDEQYVISKELRDVFQTARVLEQTPKAYINEIRRILMKEFERYERIFLILDGFDEMEAVERIELRRSLLNLCPNRLSLVITMRAIEGQTTIPGIQYCDRCKESVSLFVRCTICDGGEYDVCYACRAKNLTCLDPYHSLHEPYSSRVIDFEDFETQILDDIRRYVRHTIGMDIRNDNPLLRDERSAGPDDPDLTPFQKLCQKEPNLPDQIVDAVTRKSKGRFLHARLYMESLKRKSNIRLLKKALSSFPDSMEDIYQEAMRRVEANKEYRTRAFEVIGLIGRARRTLSIKEVQDALAVMSFGDDEEDLGEDDILGSIDDISVLLDATSGLVIIENAGLDVRLVHRSLEEFVRDHRKEWIPTADAEIGKACLAFLNIVLPSKACSDEDLKKILSKFPFLEYASQYWGDHVRDALSDPKPDKTLETSALEFIQNEARLDTCIQAAWTTNGGGHDTWDVRRRLSRLHVCAWYGLTSLLTELEPDKHLIDAVEPKYGQTPLIYACRRGHLETVRQLIVLGASLQKSSTRGSTAMFEAVTGRHDLVVSHLAQYRTPDLNINAAHTGECSRTALLLAAYLGQIKMVSVLLDHPDIKINHQDADGATAVYLASKYGHSEIVKLLVEHGANLDICDLIVGRSPLRCAAERNHADIINLLLKGGAQLGHKDMFGSTSMLLAANNGQEDALRFLLSFDDDFEILRYQDDDGQTVLHGASRNGHSNIVRLLLTEVGEDPDPQDRIKRTPLHLAAQEGHLSVIAALLEHKAKSTVQDRNGATAKLVAWQYGHQHIVTALESHEDRENNKSSCPIPESDAELPVWALARRGLTDYLAQAIHIRPEDLGQTEPGSENTPLHCAIIGGHPEGLHSILSSDLLDVNAMNHVGRTPLMAAALAGTLSAVHTLLAHRQSPDLGLKDRWGADALLLAQSNWLVTPDGQYDEIIFNLLEAGAVIDPRKIKLERVFFAAVDKGRMKTIQICLDHGVDRSVQNPFGLRAVQIAEAREDVETQRLLNSAPTVNFGEISARAEASTVRTGQSAEARKDDETQRLLNSAPHVNSGEFSAVENGCTRAKEAEDLRKTKFVPFRSRPVVLE